MTNIQKIADRVLKRELGKFGLDKVIVREGRDHDGEEALFIDARMKPGAPIVGGRISTAAHGALSEALLKAGERRFPYFNIRHVDEEPVDQPWRRTSRQAS